jgi:hypothetical protein
MAALQRFTLLEKVVVTNISMLDRFCNRVEFPRAFAYLNTISWRKFQPKAGGNHLHLHCDTPANRQSFWFLLLTISQHQIKRLHYFNTG